MRTMKLAIAFALFMTSISYESQIITTKSGLDTNWTASIQVTNQAFATYAMEASMEAF